MHYILRIWDEAGPESDAGYKYRYDSEGRVDASPKIIIDTLRSLADDIENRYGQIHIKPQPHRDWIPCGKGICAKEEGHTGRCNY